MNKSFLFTCLLQYWLLSALCGFAGNCSAQESLLIRDSLCSFTSPLSPDLIHLNINKLKFRFSPMEKVDFGIEENRWCYMVIKTKIDDNTSRYFLSIDNTGIDTVMIFELKAGDQKALRYLGGTQVPYHKNRRYVWHTCELNRDGAISYYLAALRSRTKNLNVRYFLLTEEALARRYAFFDRVIWFYLGVVFFIAVAATWGMLIFKNRSLLFYLCYVFFVSCWILAHYGYIYPMLYPDIPGLNMIIAPLTILMAILAFLKLLQSLFQEHLRDNYSRLALAIMLYTTIALLAILTAFVFAPKAVRMFTVFNVAWHICFLAMLCIILAILVRLFTINHSARLFCLAIGSITIMAIQQVLSNAGAFFIPVLNDHGMLIGSIAEFTLMIYGIFLNLWEEKKRATQRISWLELEHTRTLQQLVMIQDDERKRIGGDLHDSVGPMLTALKINFLRIIRAKATEQSYDELMQRTEGIIDSSIAEIRNISHRLMPRNLASRGLIASITEYCEDLQTLYNVVFSFQHNISQSPSEELQLIVYRIVSELMLNAAKHAHCKKVLCTLDISGSKINLSVSDDGTGFNTNAVMTASIGLSNIYNRVRYAKGQIDIRSAEGSGTTILITIPLTS